MNEDINSYEIIKAAQNGDEAALDSMAINNIALVKSIVSKFLNRGVEYEDLLQIGSMGLVRAIQKFDTNYEVKFSTYAVPMIAGEIKRFLRDNGTVKVSRSLKEIAYKAIKAGEEIKQKFGREATVEEISKELDLPVDDIVFAMDAVKTPMSLDEVLYDDKNNGATLENVISAKDNTDSVINRIMLKQMLSTLSGRDRQIIVLRYFHDKTQSEIANSLNISQVQVSRLENRILSQLKSKIS